MILAIVQARMTSTRLPGKVLMPVLGKPLIQHLLERLILSKRIDKIIVATSQAKESDPLETFVKNLGFEVYRGSEQDVLDRFYKAALQYRPQTVVRITGDCPLLDAAVCDEVIRVFQKDRLDYAQTGPSFAEGLDCEVFSFQSLERAWKEARLKSEREHVTLYLRNHPEFIKSKMLINGTDDSKYRLTLDEKDDYCVVKAIFEGLQGEGKKDFSMKEVKSFLDAHPEIYQVNAHIIRNEGLQRSLSEEGGVE
ncbi:MAG: glycosyltransferase family protein [Candidatus Omnitrophica bacterium]|nr:glycosyltransferase family protein [Candidatus Omnitrophota bacterium]